jgi:hypothetical protein
VAGKTNYKTMPLAELEGLAANMAAQSRRPSTALKAALNAARADAMHEAAAEQTEADRLAAKYDALDAGAKAEAQRLSDKYSESGARLDAAIAEQPEDLAPAPEPEMTDQQIDDALEIVTLAEEIAAQDAAGEPEPAGDDAGVIEVAPNVVVVSPDAVDEFIDRVVEEALQAGQATPDDAARSKARRTEFTTAFARLLDGGFTEAQAGEALAGEFPAEVAEYEAMHAMDARMVSTTPPERDPLDIDMSTGEVRVDRPATQPVPPAGSFARVEATPYPVTFYRPVLKIIVPDLDDPAKETVEELTCEHVEKYGHGSEDAAIKCARSMAYKRGLRIA